MDEVIRNLEQAVFPRGGPDRSHARTRAKLRDFRARMPEHLHVTGLELVGSIARSAPVQAESLLAWLPDLVRILPAEVADEGVGHAVRIARASVTASYGFLSHLLHVSNALGGGSLGPWVDEGLRLLEQNPSAGRAYFDLHTRHARRGLRQGDHVVHLDEIRDSLRLYVNGISGRRLEVQSTGESLDGFPARGRPWVFPFSDGNGVFLPPAVQAFNSYEENRLFYRILAAHQAGYHEFDTFGFGLLGYLERMARHPVLGRWKPDLQRREGTDDFLSDLQVFFHLFPRPGLAQRIFVAVEDGRVDARLRHRYPGLKADMGPFVEDILSRRPAPGRLPFGASLMELLLQASLDPGRKADGLPPGLAYVRRLLADRLGKALTPEATVEDAAVTATELYWFFNGLLKMQFELTELRRGGGPADLAGDGELEYLSAEELATLDFLDAIGAELEEDRAEAEGLGDLDVPLEFRGDTDLGEVQKGLQVAEHLENAASDNNQPGNQVLSLDELRRLLEQGVEITVESMREDMLEGPGLFYQNPSQAFPLMPQLKKNREQGRVLTGQMLSLLRREHRRTSRESDATIHYYDEWDHTIQDYREGWCRLLERQIAQDGKGFAEKVRAAYGPLIPSVRRQFEKIRPEEYRKEKSLLDGEEIDLDRTVEHLIDRMCGLPGTNRLYQQRRKVQRDVCTVFLVDMSSSTSEPVCVPVEAEGAPSCPDPGSAGAEAQGPPAAAEGVDGLSRILSGLRTGPAAAEGPAGGDAGGGSRKRIIDVEKEALILLAEALRALGDRYAIYGFSGCGRMQVDFYTIKEFSQRYTNQVKDRIGAIEPKGSTRMGTALRHCRAKLAREDARRKNLFLLSDGFPQDQDYGYDRTSHEYGVQDTARALVELEQDGIHTYCITVDRRGEDYLKKMCPESQYMVIHDILSLPEVLLKLYRKVTT